MKVVNVYEAKTNLSKYIRQAKAGKTVYIGAYGHPEVKMVANTKKARPERLFGIWADQPIGYKDEDIVGSDPDVAADFEESINKSFPI